MMDSVIYKATLDHQLVLSSWIIEELFEVVKRKFPTKIPAMMILTMW